MNHKERLKKLIPQMKAKSRPKRKKSKIASKKYVLNSTQKSSKKVLLNKRRKNSKHKKNQNYRVNRVSRDFA